MWQRRPPGPAHLQGVSLPLRPQERILTESRKQDDTGCHPGHSGAVFGGSFLFPLPAHLGAQLSCHTVKEGT